ncbi:MAG: hypothetical protein ABR535_04090 [Pyrinomonadaceae bacterium]
MFQKIEYSQSSVNLKLSIPQWKNRCPPETEKSEELRGFLALAFSPDGDGDRVPGPKQLWLKMTSMSISITATDMPD